VTRIEAPWLDDPRTRAVSAAVEAGGHAILFVGGCVRNALLGRPVTDIDLATDAPPDAVVALTRAAGLNPVPTGIAHGTVTVVSGGRPFEVTTFRRDVETFGRHAVVAFSDDIAEDAARRDFTLNALYARPDGSVVDPLGGLPDLRAGRVRFVGDAGSRIAEDYLRILRFFRMTAWYGDPALGLDADGLAACAAGQDGLGGLSRERVGAETTKLLAARDPAPAVAAMAATGILGRVLPGADATALAPLVDLEGDRPPRWQRRLAALGWREPWAAALRLSRADARALEATAAALAAGEPPEVAAYRHGRDAALDAALVRAASAAAPLPAGLDEAVERGASARFPMRAADVPLAGPALGAELRRLEEAWVASGFTLDPEALRRMIRRR
jgi:poly(A) polymerase